MYPPSSPSLKGSGHGVSSSKCWSIQKMAHTSKSIYPGRSFRCRVNSPSLSFFAQLMELTSRLEFRIQTQELLVEVLITVEDVSHIYWARLYLCLCCIISATKCILTDHRWAQCTGGSPNWMYHQLTSKPCLNNRPSSGFDLISKVAGQNGSQSNK